MTHTRPEERSLQILACLAVTLFVSAVLTACGGGGDLPIAQQGSVAVVKASAGATPFISVLVIEGANLARMTSVDFTIQQKPGSLARPVHVRQGIEFLVRRGYATSGANTIRLPVFGLYAAHANQVHLDIRYADGSHASLDHEVVTERYVDKNGIYDRINILKARPASSQLGFNYFFLKSSYGTPVVFDTDGEVRWTGDPAVPTSASSIFIDGGFFVGDNKSLQTTRIELDGTSTSGLLTSSPYTNFHHNIDPGKTGLLTEFDSILDGTPYIETILSEMTSAGTLLSEWDMGKIIGEYMTSQGDDPTLFVRPGIDWFHMNAALYDPSDDSVVASSRENFLVKVDYRTKRIIWIFGDPTKYWYTFPSLRARALTLAPGGLYPIGQHGISMTSDRKLLLFNNGYPSFRQPSGAPSGESRNYSAVSAYVIDGSAKTAVEAWRFDYDKTVHADICSNALQTPDGSLLINYSSASDRTRNKIVGLDATRNVVFDFELPTTLCQTSFNTQVIPLEALVL